MNKFEEAVVRLCNKAYSHDQRLLTIELDGFTEQQYKELRRIIKEELAKQHAEGKVHMEVKAGGLEIKGKGASEGFWWAVIGSAVAAIIIKALVDKI